MSEVVNDAKTFARNAKGVREVLSMKFDTFPFSGAWYDAFGTPERCARNCASMAAWHTTVWKKVLASRCRIP